MYKLDQFLAEIRKAQNKKQYLDIFKNFKYKLDQEIPSDISSDYNQTLLHCAAVVDNAELTQALIEAGANIDAIDLEECTPLYRAVSNGSIKVLKILLKAGASTKPYRPGNTSPLHIAVRRGFNLGVKLLIEAKADVRARDENGIEPIHYIGATALFNIHEGLCAMAAKDALEPDAIDSVEPKLESNNSDLQCLKLLLKHGADIKATDSFGYNVLQANALARPVAVIKYLIKNGAQVNQTNQFGRTALHTLLGGTFCTTTIPSIKTLLENGANPNLKDESGQIPLDLLEKNSNFDTAWKKKIIKIIKKFENHND